MKNPVYNLIISVVKTRKRVITLGDFARTLAEEKLCLLMCSINIGARSVSRVKLERGGGEGGKRRVARFMYDDVETVKAKKKARAPRPGTVVQFSVVQVSRLRKAGLGSRRFSCYLARVMATCVYVCVRARPAAHTTTRRPRRQKKNVSSRDRLFSPGFRASAENR